MFKSGLWRHRLSMAGKIGFEHVQEGPAEVDLAATRRSPGAGDDDGDMSEQPGGPAAPAGAGAGLLALYDHALPQVYGYLLSRCGQRALAEDLTAETFLAAVDAVRAGRAAHVSTGWLVGVARHKLSDHWRRQAREQRVLRAVAAEPGPAHGPDDPWDARLDAMAARDVLGRLGPHHRAALTLRYMDDLPVPEVADLLGRTVHATEALLVRARSAFRAVYTHGGKEAGDE
jgi:RNA polymerase sigma-70 factor (ECF subfamily)